MIPRSGTSRRQIKYFSFDQTENHDWIMVVPKYYADLFSLEEPEILKKSNTGWRVSRNPRQKFAFFKELEQSEIGRVESFLKEYEKWIILDLNEHITSSFTDELDFCLALGWPAENPKELSMKNRSRIGELVYQAKYKRKMNKANELAIALSRAVKRISKGKTKGPISSSVVPSDSYEDFYLPKYLAEKLAADNSLSRIRDSSNPIIESRITTKLYKLKNISIKSKLFVCEELYANNRVSLANSVKGYNIVIIDDFYQSGTTMWSYAKFLKDKGATTVFGLACEKNFRDSDNI